MKIYLDLIKADDPTAPGSNTPKGAIPAGTKKQSKYGQKVWHRGKDRYPKRPNNALDETASTWVLPYGQKPEYSKTDTKSEQSESPTPEEHQKLSEVAAQMGNTKLAEKHSLLAKPKSKSAYEVDPKYHNKINDLNTSDKGSFEHTIEEVSLADIDIPEAWSNSKLDQATKDIKEGKKLDPIRAEMGDNGKLVIEDGIHRSNAAKLLGHSYIPVHITRKAGEKKQETPANSKDNKEAIKLPETSQEKAQNLLHNSKATEAKRKAKEVLRAVPSEQKEALKKIIEVLEDHETKPHVPTNKEKKDLKEMISAVNSISKPIDKKRAEISKEFKNKIKEKEKDNKKIYIKTEKDKERVQKEEKRNKEKELKAKEKEEKERNKVAASKQKAHDKLKEKLDRDIKKPASIEEEAQKTTHVAEAKEVLQQIEAQLAELDKTKDNPELTKLLEAHRAVAKRQLEVDRLPTKEDIKSLRDSKKVIQQKIKQQQDKAEAASDNNNNKVTETQATQGQSSALKTRNAYNTGRATGEQVAHQATEESGAQLSGKAAGAVGYGVASAGHKLLTNEDDNKVITRKERVNKALSQEDAVGIDSETGRNTDTFDDEQPVGMGSDITEDDGDFNKALLNKLEGILPKTNKTENEFLYSLGYSKNVVEKGLVRITGLKQSKYQDYVCNRLKGSINNLLKSL